MDFQAGADGLTGSGGAAEAADAHHPLRERPTAAAAGRHVGRGSSPEAQTQTGTATETGKQMKISNLAKCFF